MGDGAREISKAGEEVFGNEGVRLMCWPHTYRNLMTRMSALRNANRKLQEQLMSDIQCMQWSVHSVETFIVVFDLLEAKYVKGNYTDGELDLLKNFFEYFRAQWGPESHVSKWWEGANPWAVSNNQGIEGTNKAIKKDHTFKRRCPLGTFMDIVTRMVMEWGEVDDSLLFGSRMDLLESNKDGLKLKTQGYQWLKASKVTNSDRILRVDPRGKYTVSESPEFNLGKVDAIWVVASSENPFPDQCLKKLAKQRITLRGNPEFVSFDQYMDIRQSCWILEERDGEFYCDCPVGMKVCA